MSPHRYDVTGDRLDVDDDTQAHGASRKALTRKGRPIGGLARTLAELGDKCADCARFICACETAA